MHPSFRLFPALLRLGLSSVALPYLGQALAKLILAACTKRRPPRDSDSRSLDLILPALLGAADGGPKHHASATSVGLTKELFFERFKLQQCEFGEMNPIPSR